MKRLGQFLIELGWIEEDDLSRALQSQEVLGGRLGTCLLEIGALDEELLSKALGHQLGVESTKQRDLRNIPREVYGLLPPKVARRCQAVPFRMLGGDIHVAMLDVHNLAFHDEIAFATGKTVHPHVANEARVLEALDTYYGIEAPVRFKQLLTRLNENGTRPQEDLLPELIEGEAESPPDDSVEITAPVWLDELQLDAGPPPPPLTHSAAPPRATTPLPADPPTEELPAAAALEIRFQESTREPTVALETVAGEEEDGFDAEERIEAELRKAQDPTDIATRTLAYLTPRFETVVLFKIRRDEITGWMGSGPELDEGRLRSLSLGFDEPSLFLNFREAGLFFAGPLPPMPSHVEIAKCWGGDLPEQCLLLPVRVQDRLVCSILCIPGSTDLLEVDLEGMSHLAHQVGAALQSCIARTKHQFS